MAASIVWWRFTQASLRSDGLVGRSSCLAIAPAATRGFGFDALLRTVLRRRCGPGCRTFVWYVHRMGGARKAPGHVA